MGAQPALTTASFLRGIIRYFPREVKEVTKQIGQYIDEIKQVGLEEKEKERIKSLIELAKQAKRLKWEVVLSVRKMLNMRIPARAKELRSFPYQDYRKELDLIKKKAETLYKRVMEKIKKEKSLLKYMDMVNRSSIRPSREILDRYRDYIRDLTSLHSRLEMFDDPVIPSGIRRMVKNTIDSLEGKIYDLYSIVQGTLSPKIRFEYLEKIKEQLEKFLTTLENYKKTKRDGVLIAQMRPVIRSYSLGKPELVGQVYDWTFTNMSHLLRDILKEQWKHRKRKDKNAHSAYEPLRADVEAILRDMIKFKKENIRHFGIPVKEAPDRVKSKLHGYRYVFLPNFTNMFNRLRATYKSFGNLLTKQTKGIKKPPKSYDLLARLKLLGYISGIKKAKENGVIKSNHLGILILNQLSNIFSKLEPKEQILAIKGGFFNVNKNIIKSLLLNPISKATLAELTPEVFRKYRSSKKIREDEYVELYQKLVDIIELLKQQKLFQYIKPFKSIRERLRTLKKDIDRMISERGETKIIEFEFKKDIDRLKQEFVNQILKIMNIAPKELKKKIEEAGLLKSYLKKMWFLEEGTEKEARIIAHQSVWNPIIFDWNKQVDKWKKIKRETNQVYNFFIKEMRKRGYSSDAINKVLKKIYDDVVSIYNSKNKEFQKGFLKAKKEDNPDKAKEIVKKIELNNIEFRKELVKIGKDIYQKIEKGKRN